jgi:hypothetical protein
MAVDPEELVTLTDHGTMKLRSAVVRAMILPAKERKRAKILREGEPAILNFKQIRNLGAKWDERNLAKQWEERLVPINWGRPSIASPAAKAATTNRRQRPHIRKAGTRAHNTRMPHKSKPADKKSGHKRSPRRMRA